MGLLVKVDTNTAKHVLTVDELRDVLSYDPETGIFAWAKTASNRRAAGECAGCLCKNSGYMLIGYKGRVYKSSRLAWFYVHGEWPPGIVDHINGDRTDDRVSNLRIATHSQNLYNRGAQRNNSSGFKGVYWHKPTRKWRARIMSDGLSRSLGLYDTPEEAHQAYAFAASKLHGEFAKVK